MKHKVTLIMSSIVAIAVLAGCSKNDEELKALNTQNAELQNEIEGLRSHGESIESDKTSLQAEVSDLKATMEKDYVPKAEFSNLKATMKNDYVPKAEFSNLKATMKNDYVPKADHAVALKKIESLEKQKRDLATQLDDVINGAERLLAEAEKEFADENYESAKEKLTMLLDKHPDYSDDKKVAALKDKIAKQKALADTGDWTVSNYVDEFGDITNNGYVAKMFLASMDNSAVQGASSQLILRASKDMIIFQLYPYGGDSHETWFRKEYWTWRVKDEDGKRHTLRAETGESAILFKRVGRTSFTALHALLMKGGELQFVGSHERDRWSFTIPNADGFKKAWGTVMAADKP
jgi:cell division protein FtsB